MGTIALIIAGIFGATALGALVYVFMGAGDAPAGGDLRELMSSNAARSQAPQMGRRRRTPEEVDLNIEEIKKKAGAATLREKKEDISVRLFKAGFYTASERQRFKKTQLIAPFITTPLFPLILYLTSGKPVTVAVGLFIGIFAGYSIPVSWLEKQVRRREEETFYYLPLVIEQVAIGVSSSLDIGPCIAQIVQMANERDSHNPVTEMFVHVEKLMRSGLNLEDALIEVGDANGMTEIKHAFMFLAQCSKHGGEVSKQLQELADSVMVQRQTQIEGKIAGLPVKATGPLVIVFAGFFALLLAGLIVRITAAFEM